MHRCSARLPTHSWDFLAAPHHVFLVQRPHRLHVSNRHALCPPSFFQLCMCTSARVTCESLQLPWKWNVLSSLPCANKRRKRLSKCCPWCLRFPDPGCQEPCRHRLPKLARPYSNTGGCQGYGFCPLVAHVVTSQSALGCGQAWPHHYIAQPRTDGHGIITAHATDTTAHIDAVNLLIIWSSDPLSDSHVGQRGARALPPHCAL